MVLGWNRDDCPAEANLWRLWRRRCGIAPDLALYRDVIAGVRSGRGYYAVAGEKIPQYGFPIASPLNWRLPTYAWLLSRLPGPAWVQGLLVILSVVGLALAFVAQCRVTGVVYAAATSFLLFGVVRWAIDGQAYLAQEPWGGDADDCFAGGNRAGQRHRTRRIDGGDCRRRGAIVSRAGAAVLCGGWSCRCGKAAVGGGGVGGGHRVFFAFFAWHVGQVKGQLVGLEAVTAAGAV